MPRFSIVIPTLRRPDTLRHALTTAAAQSLQDVEIIVQNNGRDPATEALVRQLDNPRIRHFWSSSVVTMTENWEAALANAGGELITFIGDDDGLFPDACRTAGDIFDRADVEIVSWHPFCYYWPNCVRPELRNWLIALVDYNPHVQIVSSEDQLRRFYRFAIHYSRLPMIYNSFVRRRVIERITRETERYFLGNAPDVTSGIVNAAFTARFARLSTPLSMAGLSHHSTGDNTFLTSRGSVSADRMERDFGTSRIDDRLVQSDDLQIFIADNMLLLQDRIPSLRDRVKLDFHGLVQSLAAAINDRPEGYEDTLATVRQLAARHDIDVDSIAISQPATRHRAARAGATMVGPNRVQFAIDGRTVPLASTADAIGLMGQFMPPVDGTTIEIRNLNGADRASARRGETLTFGFDGNGAAALADGWGEPEAWGIWSVAKRASMNFALERPAAKAVRANLRYRAFVPTTGPHLTVICRVAGKKVATWDCPDATPARVQELTIPAGLVRPGGLVELELLISNPRSPAELGLGADMRLLGIGIEAMSFPA